MIFIPRIHACEIHITYRCNLRCSHCHNLVGSAPSNEDMSLEWLKKLLDDSVALHYPWEWLVLHGGEPCLHPRFDEVCEMLGFYKQQHNPTVNLRCTTNGYGPHNADKMKTASLYGLEVCDSHKDGSTPNITYHTNVLSSPADLGEESSLGCFQSSECGICYTPRGFYECSPSGAAWRVMGYEPLCREVKDLTAEKLAEGFKTHCKNCGYSRYPNRGWKDNDLLPISKTWQEALDKYNSMAAKRNG